MRLFETVEDTRGAAAGASSTASEEKAPRSLGKARRAKRATVVSVISRLSRALLSDSDRGSIEQALVEAAQQVFPTAIVAVWGERRSDLRLASAGNGLTKESLRLLCSWESALEAVVQRAARPITVFDRRRNGTGEAAQTLRELGLAGYLRVPLSSGNQDFGRLSLYFKVRPLFERDHVEALEVLAAHVSSALRNLRLEARALEQSSELRQATDDLARAHVAKSEFLSVVSHEFRTPLNIIMGYAALIEEELVGPIKDEQRRCLEQIRHASNDLLAMIMSMLQAGGLEAGLITANLESLALEPFLQRVKTDIRLPQNADVSIFWDIPENLPAISTDPEKLKQVLHNLIDNAVKFTDRGEVRIWSKIVPEHRQVEFKVSDTGIGIPSEVLPVVFERYRQLDGSITRAYEGLGLGLFIAKRFTDLLGGSLTVVSEPGAGSTFTVTLPLSA